MNNFDIAIEVINTLRDNSLTLVTAESCTGGLIASTITDISGSSDVFHGGFVSYANAAKTNMLGVDDALIKTHGAVSRKVAIAMAEGALKNSPANIAVAVTGIAGPTGGTVEKPVGLVHIAVVTASISNAHKFMFENANRSEVRVKTVYKALEMVLKLVEKQ